MRSLFTVSIATEPLRQVLQKIWYSGGAGHAHPVRRRAGAFRGRRQGYRKVTAREVFVDTALALVIGNICDP